MMRLVSARQPAANSPNSLDPSIQPKRAQAVFLRWLAGSALIGCLGLTGTAAHAAISLTSINVVADGSGTFDADNAAGHDMGANNGYVRAQDTISYQINYTASNTTTDTITLTAPAGVQFESASLAGSVCNGPSGGSLNPAKNILTCSRKPINTGTESFGVVLRPGAVANGANINLWGASASIPAATVLSPNTLVSAKPQTQIRTYPSGLTRVLDPSGSGTYGRRLQQNIYFGAQVPVGETTSTPDFFKGYEALKLPFNIQVTMPTGGQLISGSCTGGTGTTVTCAQSGLVVTLTVDKMTTDFQNPISAAAIPANFRQASAGSYIQLAVWAPENPNFPTDVRSNFDLIDSHFDATGLSGVDNVNGQPGFDNPSFTCGSTDWKGTVGAEACIRVVVDRTSPLKGSPSATGAVRDAGNYLYGDGHGFTQNREKLVPGQRFVAMNGVANLATSEQNMLNPSGCVAWDPQLLEMVTPASLYLISGNTLFYAPSHLTTTNILTASSGGVIEYSTQSFADDTARRTVNCGTPGVADPAWSATPPANPAQVTAIRYAYEAVGLAPNSTLGLGIPMRRSVSAASMALPAGAILPWFRQWRAPYPEPTSNGAWVQMPSAQTVATAVEGSPFMGSVQAAATALARHTVTISPSAIAPNNLATYTVTPLALGPEDASVNGLAKNVVVTITFPNTYLQPDPASLPPGASMTLANLGPDGIAGTSDDGAPATVTLAFGDLAAPGGTATALYQAHVTPGAPQSFKVLAAAVTPVGTYTGVSVVTSDSDNSFQNYTNIPNMAPTAVAQDRTEYPALQVSGVASFSVNKDVSSGAVANPGGPAAPPIVTAGEPFTYAINFANATSNATGVAAFVDVLPFNGDARGTTGLTSPLQLVSATAAMAATSQGAIGIEYTTDPAAEVQTAVRTAGNENAATGVTWVAYTGGAFPATVTALRFTTSSGLSPGYSGKLQITVRTTSPLTSTSQLVNDVYGRTNDSSPKVIQATSPATVLGQAAASLTGSVYDDANSNNVQEGAETGIAGLTVTVSCTQAGSCTAGETHTATTAADGSYSFAPGATVDGQANFVGLPSGTWTVSINPGAVWTGVGATAGTAGGAAVVRTISGVTLASGVTATGYLFAEHQTPGGVRVTKALTLPSGVSGPFSFDFTATCNGTSYQATLANYPTNTFVDIGGIPAGASCTVTEKQKPANPVGYTWETEVVAPTTSQAVPANGMAAFTVTNALKAVVANVQVSVTPVLPSGVTGPFKFDVTATCDKPTATSQFTGSVTASTAAPVDLTGLQTGSQCTVAVVLPTAPDGYEWQTPQITPANFVVPTTAGGAVATVNVKLVAKEAVAVTPVPVNTPMGLLLLSALLAWMASLVQARRTPR